MIIQPGTTHSFTVERSFHISKAVYDFSSPYSSSMHIKTLMVDCDDKKGIILCHLKNDYDDCEPEGRSYMAGRYLRRLFVAHSSPPVSARALGSPQTVDELTIFYIVYSLSNSTAFSRSESCCCPASRPSVYFASLYRSHFISRNNRATPRM
jgi:hypothetical protein